MFSIKSHYYFVSLNMLFYMCFFFFFPVCLGLILVFTVWNSLSLNFCLISVQHLWKSLAIIFSHLSFVLLCLYYSVIPIKHMFTFYIILHLMMFCSSFFFFSSLSVSSCVIIIDLLKISFVLFLAVLILMMSPSTLYFISLTVFLL